YQINSTVLIEDPGSNCRKIMPLPCVGLHWNFRIHFVRFGNSIVQQIGTNSAMPHLTSLFQVITGSMQMWMETSAIKRLAKFRFAQVAMDDIQFLDGRTITNGPGTFHLTNFHQLSIRRKVMLQQQTTR